MNRTGHEDDIAHGIVLPDVYDGISIWVLTDGTLVNRWEHVPGCEGRAARTDSYIAVHESAMRQRLLHQEETNV